MGKPEFKHQRHAQTERYLAGCNDENVLHIDDQCFGKIFIFQDSEIVVESAEFPFNAGHTAVESIVDGPEHRQNYKNTVENGSGCDKPEDCLFVSQNFIHKATLSIKVR